MIRKMARRRPERRKIKMNTYVLCFIICCLFFLNLLSYYNQTKMFNKRECLELTKRGVGVEVGVGVADWRHHFYIQSQFLPISGHRNLTKKFLSIGIPTVYRSQEYLKTTLESFIRESTPEEKNNAVIIIYLADTNSSLKAMQRKLIETNFWLHLDSGFIQIITSTPDIYPPFDIPLVLGNDNDSLELVQWRSKRTVDLAFLFAYAYNISEYHLVVGDDIITGRQYVAGIRDFIRTQEKDKWPWVVLAFACFPIEGLLFKNNDLPGLTDLFLTAYQFKPVDALINILISLKPNTTVPRATRMRVPSLFQHIGEISTFTNRTHMNTDPTFGLADRYYKNQNPPANLFTTMEVFNGMVPSYAYKQTPGYFWGAHVRLPDEIFDIVFDVPINISRVIIITGIQVEQGEPELKDTIQDGILEMNAKSAVGSKKYTQISTFRNGRLDVQKNLMSVMSLRVKIGGEQKTWVIIREIEIFQQKTYVRNIVWT